MLSEKLTFKFPEIERNHVETECKCGDIESLEDELKSSQVKIQDQVKLETEKIRKV